MDENYVFLSITEMGAALMYTNGLNPLVPAAVYPPYIWPHLPGLFLPYSPPIQRQETLSPERASTVEQGYTPEKARLGQCFRFV